MLAGKLGRMGIVAGMHVAAFFMVAASLGIVPISVATKPIETFPVERPQTREAPPPIREPTLEQHEVTLERPVVVVDSGETDIGITTRITDPGLIDGGDTGSAVVESPIVGPRQDARHPLSQPTY